MINGDSNYFATLTFTELQQSKQQKQLEIEEMRQQLNDAITLEEPSRHNERMAIMLRIKHLRDDLEAIEKAIGWYS